MLKLRTDQWESPQWLERAAMLNRVNRLDIDRLEKNQRLAEMTSHCIECESLSLVVVDGQVVFFPLYCCPSCRPFSPPRGTENEGLLAGYKTDLGGLHRGSRT